MMYVCDICDTDVVAQTETIMYYAVCPQAMPPNNPQVTGGDDGFVKLRY